MIPVQKNMRSQAGFTLVELAIVMIIIGLLIAGVLKGQAYANAKVAARSRRSRPLMPPSTFKDMYAALPGDITTPAAPLPNCAAAPCIRLATVTETSVRLLVVSLPLTRLLLVSRLLFAI